MFGISWFEFLLILFISFICLKPADFRKIISTIRYIINYFNNLVAEAKEKLDQSIALDDLKIEDFYIIDKKEEKKEDSIAKNNDKL